jgi:hypothetical protein
MAFSDHAGSGMIGKSHLAQAIGREVLKAGFLVLYRSIFDLVRELLSQVWDSKSCRKRAAKSSWKSLCVARKPFDDDDLKSDRRMG